MGKKEMSKTEAAILILIVILGVFAYFLLNQTERNIKQNLENVIRQYFEIQKGIGEEFLNKISQESAFKKQDSQYKNIFHAEIALAQENSLNKSALIARGIAAFLEIGRDKDITNAREINTEDITSIYIASDNLKEIFYEAYTLQRSRAWDDENIENFLDILLEQYKDMDGLLGELLVYKRFNAEQLAATRLEKIEESIKDQIEIMKAWKAGGFREPLQQIILHEFFHKAEISGRAAKDRENMVRIFMINKFFKDTKPEDFKIQGLSPTSVRQWQGKG